MDLLTLTYGFILGLIPCLMLAVMTDLNLLISMLKVKMSPSRRVLVFVRPYNKFFVGERFEKGVIVNIGNVKYVFMPTDIDKLNGLPYLDVLITEGYVLDGKAKAELDKLIKAAGKEVASQYISLLLRRKELKSMLENGLVDAEQGKRVLDEMNYEIIRIEERYKVCIEDTYLPESEGDLKIKSVKVLVPIDYNKIKECVIAINPLNIYYYAENLAYSLMKRFKMDNWFWVVAIVTILIGGAIAWKLIGG